MSEEATTKSRELGRWIRASRLTAGLSQRELAARLRINYAHLCRIESGLRRPGPESVVGLATFLGVPTDALLRLYAEDHLAERRARQETQLTPAAIEELAQSDRATFDERSGRANLELPRDTTRIPGVLCGLGVIYEKVVFGAPNRQIRAGLFVGRHTYRDRENAIVVATEYIGSEGGDLREQTKVFQVLHEVGHFRLHWKASSEQTVTTPPIPDRALFCSAGDRTTIEEQANQYAAAFLMPAPRLLAAIGNRRTVNWDRNGPRLCELFSVTPWSLRYRLRRLGIAAP